MMTLSNGYLRVILGSISIYVFMIFAIKLFGQKELGQLSVIDLVFILLISNSVQNAMVGNDTTLEGGIIGATSLFIANYLFKVMLYRIPKLSKTIQGEPLMLIYKGELNINNIRKIKLTNTELMEAIRENGAASIEEVDLAVLEADGNISVLSNESKDKKEKFSSEDMQKLL
jgi:uncharacterized membrane protein YcaP (DUF421 family)